MPEITFNRGEKKLILHLLNQRRLLYKNEGVTKYDKYFKEISEKLISTWDNLYNSRHKTLINSCLSEYYNPLRIKKWTYAEMPANEFVRILFERFEEFEIFDTCASILNKTGYDKPGFLFYEIHDKVLKLKNSEKLFLSRTTATNIYKIVFINKTEIWPFELSSHADLIHGKFIKKTHKQIKDISADYTDFVDRKKAQSIILKSSPELNNKDTFDLINFILQ